MCHSAPHLLSPRPSVACNLMCRPQSTCNYTLAMPYASRSHLEIRRGQLRIDRVLVHRRLAAVLAGGHLRSIRGLHAAASPGAAPPSKWTPATTVGEALYVSRLLLRITACALLPQMQGLLLKVSLEQPDF